ncbi:LysR family transcriptional regulator [Terasakiispira papahanaumokuakeensis]|uniref:LysR family transcriptional regulator n=1 Tax=Terasakiispira papahanaumokuakeensis TaxID=197479 RepID=A0A1E2VD35_9GAMM|nr:LysR family transcriptional regulator [Terasakiispira papahanaumokuakeensis]ODC04575.1 LysR family transcriptional regulator [Terasakiispira papahanaumokuakeensis]
MADLSLSHFCNWLRFRHLVLIDTLGRTRNMHLAAEQMNLSQPAVSKMLKEIESLLGFAVFERLPRSMPPTDLGQHVLRYAQTVLNEAEGFVSQTNRLSNGGHGYLKVGGIFAATAAVLPDGIVEIKQRWPLLEVEVIEETSNRLMKMLEEKALDLAVGRFTEQRQSQQFDFTPLAPEPFCLVVNHQHPLAGSEQVLSLDTLLAWPWILYPKGTPIRDRMESAFAEAGVQVPANILVTISMHTCLKVLERSQMIAMLPIAMVGEYIERGVLTMLETQLTLVPQYYGILTRKDEPLVGPAQEFSDILQRHAQKQILTTM